MTSLGSLFQDSATLKVKKLMSRWNFLFYVMPITPCPIAGHHQKGSGSTCIRYIYMHSQFSPLQTKQAQLLSLLKRDEMMRHHPCGLHWTLCSSSLPLLP